MYVRFETAQYCADAQCRRGIFCGAYDLLYTPVTRDDWRLKELRRELDWFNDHLGEPARMYYRPHRKAERSGVCWFHDRARSCINHARYVAWLLRDLGVNVEELHHTAPGHIIWQDENQVVALRPRSL